MKLKRLFTASLLAIGLLFATILVTNTSITKPVFAANAATPAVATDYITLSGRVMSSSGGGLRNGQISFTDTGSQTLYSTSTTSLGYYSIAVPANQNYQVEVTHGQWQFNTMVMCFGGSYALGIDLYGIAPPE